MNGETECQASQCWTATKAAAAVPQYHGLPASLLAHIERKTEDVWKSIDDLQKAVEAVPPAQRSGPEWGEDREHSKRFAELVKRLGDIRHQHRSAS
jgi:hypothetical protein